MQGLGDDILEEKYPHPYLVLWLECKRRADTHGTPDYPEPDKGYLEQDADLMLAFEAFEELQEVRRKQDERREQVRQEAARLWGPS